MIETKTLEMSIKDAVQEYYWSIPKENLESAWNYPEKDTLKLMNEKHWVSILTTAVMITLESNRDIEDDKFEFANDLKAVTQNVVDEYSLVEVVTSPLKLIRDMANGRHN